MERQLKKNPFVSGYQVLKNLKSLKKSLHLSKQGNGRYSDMIMKNSNRDEFIELINKSVIPDHKNGIVNTGTSMNPNIYLKEDTPIWIDGDMGSVWFDCKTSDGDFWRISLKDGKFFHVEDLQYSLVLHQESLLSQLSGKPIPTRDEIYEKIIDTKIMCEFNTSSMLNGDEELIIHRDLTNVGLDIVNSTVRKVKDGFSYHDKGWGTDVPPLLFTDPDRLIWEFYLPKSLKKHIIKLNDVSQSDR